MGKDKPSGKGARGDGDQKVTRFNAMLPLQGFERFLGGFKFWKSLKRVLTVQQPVGTVPGLPLIAEPYRSTSADIGWNGFWTKSR